MVQANRLAYKDMKPAYYYLATIVFYGIQMGMAIVITDISTIFDFASAIAITALAFIFPGMFYKMAVAKYGKDKQLDKCDNCWATAFLIIGCCNFCLGMYSSIGNVISGGGGE